jgi:hypothetical protein
MPEYTKKIGMRKPCPPTSSFSSSTGAVGPAHRRNTIPATNAPSTASRWHRSVTASSSTVKRNVIWLVSCWRSAKTVASRLPGRVIRDATPSSTASTTTAASDNSATNRLPMPRNTAIARIGSSSPAAPPALR